MNRGFVLLLFFALTLGGGGLIGFLTGAGSWYAELAKPSFNPPAWVFAPVWTTLYILIGFAGWRVWRAGELGLMRIWWTQLALNFLWPLIFFRAELLLPALVLILVLLMAIALFTAKAASREPVSALLFAPYLLWTAYAALLNASLWWMNA